MPGDEPIPVLVAMAVESVSIPETPGDSSPTLGLRALVVGASEPTRPDFPTPPHPPLYHASAVATTPE
jgi:hypothetical protein